MFDWELVCPTWHVRWLKRNLISWSPSSVSCHRTRSRWKPSRLDWQHLDGAENDIATTATHVSHLIYCEKSQYYFFVATVSFKGLGQQVHFSSHSFSEDVQYNSSEKTHVVITMQQSLVFTWKLCYAKHGAIGISTFTMSFKRYLVQVLQLLSILTLTLPTKIW